MLFLFHTECVFSRKIKVLSRTRLYIFIGGGTEQCKRRRRLNNNITYYNIPRVGRRIIGRNDDGPRVVAKPGCTHHVITLLPYIRIVYIFALAMAHAARSLEPTRCRPETVLPRDDYSTPYTYTSHTHTARRERESSAATVERYTRRYT